MTGDGGTPDLAIQPLWPEAVAALHRAYERAPWGWDLFDGQDRALDIVAFEQLVWRGPSAQFVVATEGDELGVLARLVDLDLRHRHARFECWQLAGDVGADLAEAAMAWTLRHGFEVLGLHRISYVRPGYLADLQHPGVAARFHREGTVPDQLLRRGRLWDAEEFGLLRSEWSS